MRAHDRALFPGCTAANAVCATADLYSGPIRADLRAADCHAYANHIPAWMQVGEVVDQDLKVFGIGNLRVCDSSVLPNIPTYAGPMSSVFATAEWLSERLLA